MPKPETESLAVSEVGGPGDAEDLKFEKWHAAYRIIWKAATEVYTCAR